MLIRKFGEIDGHLCRGTLHQDPHGQLLIFYNQINHCIYLTQIFSILKHFSSLQHYICTHNTFSVSLIQSYQLPFLTKIDLIPTQHLQIVLLTAHSHTQDKPYQQPLQCKQYTYLSQNQSHSIFQKQKLLTYNYLLQKKQNKFHSHQFLCICYSNNTIIIYKIQQKQFKKYFQYNFPIPILKMSSHKGLLFITFYNKYFFVLNIHHPYVNFNAQQMTNNNLKSQKIRLKKQYPTQFKQTMNLPKSFNTQSTIQQIAQTNQQKTTVFANKQLHESCFKSDTHLQQHLQSNLQRKRRSPNKYSNVKSINIVKTQSIQTQLLSAKWQQKLQPIQMLDFTEQGKLFQCADGCLYFNQELICDQFKIKTVFNDSYDQFLHFQQQGQCSLFKFQISHCKEFVLGSHFIIAKSNENYYQKQKEQLVFSALALNQFNRQQQNQIQNLSFNKHISQYFNHHLLNYNQNNNNQTNISNISNTNFKTNTKKDLSNIHYNITKHTNINDSQEINDNIQIKINNHDQFIEIKQKQKTCSGFKKKKKSLQSFQKYIINKRSQIADENRQSNYVILSCRHFYHKILQCKRHPFINQFWTLRHNLMSQKYKSSPHKYNKNIKSNTKSNSKKQKNQKLYEEYDSLLIAECEDRKLVIKQVRIYFQQVIKTQENKRYKTIQKQIITLNNFKYNIIEVVWLGYSQMVVVGQQNRLYYVQIDYNLLQLNYSNGLSK